MTTISDDIVVKALLEAVAQCTDQSAVGDAFAIIRKQFPTLFDNNNLPNAEFHYPFETAIRIYIEQQINSVVHGHTITIDTDALKQVTARIIDLSIWLFDAKISENLPFLAMEDIFEMLTIKQCEEVFAIFERRLHVIRQSAETKTGRLLLLKATTSLFSRLTKSSDSRLYGRVLLFIAQCIPLCDRSGLNTKGDTNTDNVVVFDENDHLPDNMDISEEGGEPVDYSFYRKFWGLQRFFQAPGSIVASADSYTKFLLDSSSVLDAFSTISSSFRTNSLLTTPTTHNAGANGNEQMKEEDFNEAHSFPVFLKYLTSTKLLNVQLQDDQFRRHVLVQFLILFHALHNLAEPLSSDQSAALEPLETKTKTLLLQAPFGEHFTEMITQILFLENNWIIWKKQNCPDFEKKPVEFNLKENAKNVFEETDFSADPPALDFGNDVMNQIWSFASGNNYECLDHRPVLPSYQSFVVEPLEEEFSDEEEDFKIKNNKVFAWRSSRLITRTQMSLFSVMGYQPKFELLQAHLKKKDKMALDAPLDI